MINGIIKLFYSEVVKTKMKTMPTSEYKLREECKSIQTTVLKIESIFLKILKLIFAFLALIVSFNINTIFGIGMLLVEITYIIYKVRLEVEVKERIENVKNNIEIPQIKIESERSKSGINVLITLLLIGLVTDFNIIIKTSFIIVFIFTIKDIYSNIK